MFSLGQTLKVKFRSYYRIVSKLEATIWLALYTPNLNNAESNALTSHPALINQQ